MLFFAHARCRGLSRELLVVSAARVRATTQKRVKRLLPRKATPFRTCASAKAAGVSLRPHSADAVPCCARSCGRQRHATAPPSWRQIGWAEPGSITQNIAERSRTIHFFVFPVTSTCKSGFLHTLESGWCKNRSKHKAGNWSRVLLRNFFRSPFSVCHRPLSKIVPVTPRVVCYAGTISSRNVAGIAGNHGWLFTQEIRP